MTRDSLVELSAARTAIARACRAGDVEAEQAARAHLAVVKVQRELTAAGESGVRLSRAQGVELCEAVAGIVEGASLTASHGLLDDEMEMAR